MLTQDELKQIRADALSGDIGSYEPWGHNRAPEIVLALLDHIAELEAENERLERELDDAAVAIRHWDKNS